MTNSEATRILRSLDDIILSRFAPHPFEAGIHVCNFAAIMCEYLAMSVAFPYIQAGAVYSHYQRFVGGLGIPDENAKVTAAIGAFLVWDEFGGWELLPKSGAEGPLRLNDRVQHIHSALLRKNVEELLDGKLPTQRPGLITRTYLEQLEKGLSNPIGNCNVAHMVAFERHATAMITALWCALQRLFDISEIKSLSYFNKHIGTEMPGEKVHVQLTESMIARLVPRKQFDDFLTLCVEAYALSFRWCRDVIAYADNSRLDSIG